MNLIHPICTVILDLVLLFVVSALLGIFGISLGVLAVRIGWLVEVSTWTVGIAAILSSQMVDNSLALV